ncbi:MAG: porin family protein [bacterium]|nr:porin family protein [bacterium]
MHRLALVAFLGLVAAWAPQARAQDGELDERQELEALYVVKQQVLEQRIQDLKKDVTRPEAELVAAAAKAWVQKVEEDQRGFETSLDAKIDVNLQWSEESARAWMERGIDLRGAFVTKEHLGTWMSRLHPELPEAEIERRIAKVPEFYESTEPGYVATADDKMQTAFDNVSGVAGRPPSPDELEIETGVDATQTKVFLDDKAAKARKAKEEAERIRTNGVFPRLARGGFHLRDQFSAAQAKAKPARFSVTKSSGDDTVYKADFALIWGGFDLYSLDEESRAWAGVQKSWSVEAHVSSDDSESENAVRFRRSWNVHWSAPYFTALSLKHETDKDFDVHKTSGELLATWVPDSQVGRDLCAHLFCGDDKRLQFRWEPWLGVEGGYTWDDGGTDEDDEILRLLGRLRADWSIGYVAHQLGFKSVTLFAENTFRYLPLEDGDDTHNFFRAGLNFKLNEHLSLTFDYKNGEDAPAFEDISTWGAGLGVKF